jgi:hypothetical protein
MTFGESVHYGDARDPLANAEWHSMRPTDHLGYVRLGPDHRLFTVSLFHSLHCLDIIQHGIINQTQLVDGYSPHHFQHCMNYLRQLFLCAADATLEPIDFRPSNRSFYSPPFDRQCRDWSAVYDVVHDYHTAWIEAYPKPQW